MLIVKFVSILYSSLYVVYEILGKEKITELNQARIIINIVFFFLIKLRILNEKKTKIQITTVIRFYIDLHEADEKLLNNVRCILK